MVVEAVGHAHVDQPLLYANLKNRVANSKTNTSDNRTVLHSDFQGIPQAANQSLIGKIEARVEHRNEEDSHQDFWSARHGYVRYINRIPIYNSDRAFVAGRQPSKAELKQPFTWICNFNLTAPISQTKEFCINLPSKAECLYSGHPAQGGIPFAALRATVSELRQTLARSNLVLFCEPNFVLGVPDEGPHPRTMPLPYSLSESGNHVIPQANSWHPEEQSKTNSFHNGRGVHVYILDTGIYPNLNELHTRVIPTLDVSSGKMIVCSDGDQKCALDMHGHGTSTTSHISKVMSHSAKQATMHAVKVWDDSGHGNLTSLLQAMDWMGTNLHAPAIVTLGIDLKRESGSIKHAIDSLSSKGILCVAELNGNSAEHSDSRNGASWIVNKQALSPEPESLVSHALPVSLIGVAAALVSAHPKYTFNDVLKELENRVKHSQSTRAWDVRGSSLEHRVKHSQSSQESVVGKSSLEHHAKNNQTSQTHVFGKGSLIQLHKPCADDEERSAHCTVFIKMFPQCSNPPLAICTKVNHTKYLLERHFKPFCAKTFRFCSPETAGTTSVPRTSQIWTAAPTERPATTAIPRTETAHATATEFPGTTAIPTSETQHNLVPEVIPTEFPRSIATSRADTKHDDMAQATSTEPPGTTATLGSDTMQNHIAKLMPPEAPGSAKTPGTDKKQKGIAQGPSTSQGGAQENKLKVKSLNTGQSADDEVDLIILRGVSQALRSLSPMFDHMVNTTEALLTS